MTPGKSWYTNRYFVAVALVALASSLRVWPLDALQTRVAWLTFYPAVMVAALYGGLWVGMLATGLCCLVVLLGWPLITPAPFIKDFADWLSLAVFVVNGAMIAGIAEAMRRANLRATLAQKQAEASNKAKDIFLASMSHELRTPLNAILGFSNILRDDPDIPEKQRKTLDIINNSGQHLLSLINAVLDMAKIDSGRLSLDSTRFELRTMAREVIQLMQGRAAAKQLSLGLEMTPEIPEWVEADGDKLRQMIINLIGNAIKFTDQGSVTLHLNVRPSGAPPKCILLIDVEDTGSGIAENDQKRIFEPFVQLPTRSMHTGTGLGLSITRKFAELMDGRLSLRSKPGQGSVFSLEIPTIPVSAPEIDDATVNRKNRRISKLAPGQPEYRILVVDDQVENRLLLQQLLEPIGFAVRIAENGQAGVDSFQTWKPQLIFMDIRMPVMDGLEATRQIRGLANGQQAKIIAVTASVFKQEQERILAAGFDGLIAKPYQPHEIHDSLQSHLQLTFLTEEIRINNPLPELESSHLKIIPPELRADLEDALHQLDTEKIDTAIRRIADIAPSLAEKLADQASQLSYTKMLSLLQNSGKPQRKEGKP